jgi:hypothetical protein
MNFECHITLHFQAGKNHRVQELAKSHHWKTSGITGDPVLGPGDWFYLTTHGADWITIFNRMQGMSAALIEIGVEVVREKIELIVYDTKGKSS